MIGWLSIGLGLILPSPIMESSFIAVGWKIGVGLVLGITGYIMADLAEARRVCKRIDILTVILGLSLLVASLLPAVIGFPLYSTLGIVVRAALGVILCIAIYVLQSISRKDGSQPSQSLFQP